MKCNIYAYYGTLLGQILHNMWLPLALNPNIAKLGRYIPGIPIKNLPGQKLTSSFRKGQISDIPK